MLTSSSTILYREVLSLLLFSDVFGKASTTIISRLLANPTERITDVSSFRTKGMKATDDELLAAVDGEICAEQAEKLRIMCCNSLCYS